MDAALTKSQTLISALQKRNIQGVKYGNQELNKSFLSEIYIRTRIAESLEQAEDEEEKGKKGFIASLWGEGGKVLSSGNSSG